MTAYQKIPGPFLRDPITNKLTDQWSSPELEYLAGNEWVFTEKVDGTNIRVMWDGYRVTFGGRTDNAQLPVPLYEWLHAKFGGPEKEQLFEQKFGTSPAILYGEGYGPKIQGGGKYRSDISVVFYDARVEKWWLERDALEDVAAYFGLEIVPIVHRDSLVRTIVLVRDRRAIVAHSHWGDFAPEGLVGTTRVGLLGRGGDRIIVKLKLLDL